MTNLFLRMLQVSITAGWIVLGVLVIRLLLKKAPKWITCLLWAIVALRLIIPVFPESRISLVPSEENLPQQLITQQATLVDSIATQETPMPTQPSWESYLPTASVVWVAGMAVMLGYSLIAWLRLRHKVQVSIRQDPNIYVCDQVDSPFIFGIFRPRIYVPSGMEESTLQCVLAHENAHLRRKDHWWKPLGFLLLTVYWFHPILWLAYWLLCRDIERACDEKAIAEMDPAEKKNYSQALLLCSIPRRMIMACPVAFGEVAVAERIKGILSYKKPTVWILAISVLVCLVTAVCFLTNPKTCIHEYGGQLVTAPTCTHQGTERFTCTKCDRSYTTPVSLTAHNFDEGVVTQAPDCIHTGTRERTCTDCGAKTTETLPTTAHTAGQMTILKSPTCTEKGRISATCQVCKVVFEEELPMDSQVHSFEETVVRAATCTSAGEGLRTCTRCQYSEALTYPCKAHSYINGTVLQESTCVTQGQVQQSCVYCGTSRVAALATNDNHKWMGNSAKSYDWCALCGKTMSKGGASLSGNTFQYNNTQSSNPSFPFSNSNTGGVRPAGYLSPPVYYNNPNVPSLPSVRIWP